MSKLQDIVYGAWMIQPSMLKEIQAIYTAHMNGEKIDLKKVESGLGRPLQNSQPGYEVIDGVAVLQIQGVLAKRANLFMDISGGASYQKAENQIRNALSDGSVDSILLEIDSPGGSVDGAFEFANFIRAAAKEKPIEAFTDGTIYSAAYLIAAATNRITLKTPGSTSGAGSIGVIATHRYIQREGVEITEIVSGKNKNAMSENAPLSEEGLSEMQLMVDTIAQEFIDSVSAWRGIPAATVEAWEAKVFLGKEALQNKLVDGVSTFEEVISRMSSGVDGEQSINSFMEDNQMSEQPKNLTMEQLKSSQPDLFKEIFSEGSKAGAEFERARIQAVHDQCSMIPGYDDLAKTLMFDGKTSGPEAAVQILAAEKATLNKVKSVITAETPVEEMLEDSNPPGNSGNSGKTPEQIWESDKEIQAEFPSKEAFLAYYNANEKGLCKIKN